MTWRSEEVRVIFVFTRKQCPKVETWNILEGKSRNNNSTQTFHIPGWKCRKNRFYTLEFYLWTLLLHFEFNLNRNDNVQRKLVGKFLVCPQSQFYYVFLSKLTVKFSGSKVDVPFLELKQFVLIVLKLFKGS